MKRRKVREAIEGYLFLLPSLVILGIFVFWPIGFSLVLSFFKWDFRNMKNPTFAGFMNYKEIFSFVEPPIYPFWKALIYTLLLVGAAVIANYTLASVLEKRRSVWIDLLILVLVFSLTFTGLVYSMPILVILLLLVWYKAIGDFRSFREYNLRHLWLNLFVIVGSFVLLRYVLHLKYDLLVYIMDAKEKNDFIKALYNTGYYVALTVPITLALALVIALLLNSDIKLRAFFRTAYFIPFVTSVVAVSLVWQWMFNDEYGLLNYILSFFGVPKIMWLKDERWTIPTVAMVSIWKTVGYDAVIFLAGLQNIDKFYYEAADVDGANALQKFLYITWPLLSPTTFFLTIVSLIGAFKVFAEVFVLYQGLPGPYNNSGLTMVYYVFDLFYNQQRMGMACAAAYLLFAVILVFTLIQFKIGRRVVEYVS